MPPEDTTETVTTRFDPEEWPVLVPVAVLEGQTVSEALVDFLAPVPVVVLGYHVVPEQTPPGQARLQFEDRAQANLDDIAALGREAGGRVETRLVFTHDQEQTVDRVALETGAQVVLLPYPSGPIEWLLVPVSGNVNIDRLGQFLTRLIAGRAIDVTLATVTGAGAETGSDTLGAVETHLREQGVDGGRITRELLTGEDRLEAIIETATGYDGVVMGESEPSLRTALFGDPTETVAARTLGPVLVVRRPRSADSDVT